jgi:hypothetical protein
MSTPLYEHRQIGWLTFGPIALVVGAISLALLGSGMSTSTTLRARVRCSRTSSVFDEARHQPMRRLTSSGSRCTSNPATLAWPLDG